MKTSVYIFAVLASVMMAFDSSAQVPLYTADAVRFSQTDGGGSARFVGLGGANVSLGGDISSISGNPAGLGFYNRSSWAISPIFRYGEYNSTYEGNNTYNVGGNFQIPNMGIVLHNRFEEYAGSKWISGSFGIAINQNQSFYNNINYTGTVRQNENGLIYDFVEFSLQPFLSDDGFVTYNNLTDLENDVRAVQDYSNLAYFTDILNIYYLENDGVILDRYDYDNQTDSYSTESTLQRENIDYYGGLTTLDLSYGANYNDKLYLGAALNVNFLNSRQVRRFTEIPDNNILNFLELNEENTISGTGAAFTFGAIFKPLRIMNLGFSYTSPTMISITETQNISLETYFLNDNNFQREFINEVPSYSLRLPQKVSVGATTFISKYGFITADLEYVDYASARYSSTNGAFNGDVPEVGNNLNSTFNLKVGAEGRLNIFRARVGYAYFDNPYKNFNLNRQSISAGIGIMKKDGFFIDATYRLSSFDNPDFVAYSSSDMSSDVIRSESDISSFRLTIGKSL